MPGRRAALLAGLALAFPGAASAGQPQVQPGAFVRVGGHSCTLGFVFDGLGPHADKEFLATASHCVDQLDQLARDEKGEVFGAVGFISPAREGPGGDFALIQVRARRLPRVRPYVRGHASYPRGATVAAETSEGDRLAISGYGDAYDDSPHARENRIGRLRWDDDWQFGAAGPIGTGDSGAPIVSIKSGNALGIVAELCFGSGPECNNARGPTVQGILETARRNGLRIRLRRAGDPLTPQLAGTVPRRAQAITSLRVRPRTASTRARVRAVFVLREAGRVRLRVQRRVRTRWSTVLTLTRRARSGMNSWRLPSRAALRGGSYRVVASALSARSRVVASRQARYRVLRGRAARRA